MQKLLILAVPLLSAQVQAAVCHVSPTGGNSGNGNSWTTAISLARAFSLATCTEIRLKQGSYSRAQGFSFDRNLTLRGGYTGITANSVERSEDPSLTRLDGQNQRRVVFIDGSATAPITNATRIEALTIQNGRADGDGGGVYCEGGAGTRCSPTFANVVFKANTASGDGGAVLANGTSGGNSSPEFIDVVFENNHATSSAGAVFNWGDSGTSSPVFERVAFIGNTADSYAGALYNYGNGGTSSSTLTNVTFINNRAAGSGGAIVNTGYNDGNSSSVLTHVTFQGNRAEGSGGAVVSLGDGAGTNAPQVRASVFWGNTAGEDGPQIATSGNAHTTLTGNLIEGGCPDDGATTCTGTLIDSDPLLGALAFNGGRTPNLLPGTTSPVLAQADSATCPATDQRDSPRPPGSACDLGAVQRRPPALLTASVTGPGSVSASSGALSACAESTGQCTDTFVAEPTPEKIALTATPDAGYRLASWSGDCTGTASTCLVTMDRARSVTAAFGHIPPPTYTVGGSVSGLVGAGLVLRNNGGDDLSQTTNGAFTFATRVTQGGAYAVTVQSQPMGQSCTVAQASGSLIAANVNDVQVSCQALVVCHATPTGSGNGADWANAAPLADALQAPGCTDIRLKQGNYSRTQGFAFTRNLSLRGGYTAANPDERSQDASLTRLDGENMRRVLSLNGNTTPITTATLIEGITIARGSVNAQGFGGGLRCEATSSAASRCSPRITNVIFEDNTGGLGGAVSLQGQSGTSSPEFTAVVFRRNSAATQGGALFSEGYGSTGISSPLLTDVSFHNNTSTNAGAFLSMGSSYGRSSPVLTRVSFYDNTADSMGGAMVSMGAVNGISSPKLTNVTFHGNKGSDGGALTILGWQAGTSNPELSHITFSGNDASQRGGALLVWADAAQSRVDTVVRNSVFWGNTSATGAQAWTVAGSSASVSAQTTFSDNLIQGGCPGSTRSGSASSSSDCAGTLIGTDPLLAALANNGGLTPTLLPGAGSPVLAQANNATCPATDQRGVARPANACDLGAVQRRAPVLLAASVSGTGTVSASSGMLNLCTQSGGQCSGGYETEEGTQQITLTATPGAGHSFSGWGGDCTGTPSTCTVTMDRARSITAAFAFIPLPTYTVGGSVSGLTGSGLVLQNNGSDNLPLASNGPFAFATPVAQGGSYAVTVHTQPLGQTCTLAQGSGSMGAANLSNVVVQCVSPLAILSTSFGHLQVGQAVNPLQLEATGGFAPYTWWATDSSQPLPTGLSLSTDGVLSGQPGTSGSYSTLVTVTDNSGLSQRVTLTQAAGVSVHRVFSGSIAAANAQPMPVPVFGGWWEKLVLSAMLWGCAALGLRMRRSR